MGNHVEIAFKAGAYRENHRDYGSRSFVYLKYRVPQRDSKIMVAFFPAPTVPLNVLFCRGAQRL